MRLKCSPHRAFNAFTMEPPEWLTESTAEKRISETQLTEDSHLPEWLREATQDQPTASSKKPKKKLVYKAPTRRDSNDRSSFSGPIADSGSCQTSTNPIPNISSINSYRTSQPASITTASSPFGTVTAFTPQKSYQAIPDEDLELNLHPSEPSSVSHGYSHQSSSAPAAEDDDKSIQVGRPESDPSADSLAWWFRAFHVTAGVSAAICMVGNIYDVTEWSEYGLRSAVLHLYAAAFSIVIVGIECEVPFLLHRLKILDWWIVRGLLYLFVGCLTVDPPGDSVKRSTAQTNITLAQNVAGGALSLTAILYVFMVSSPPRILTR